MLFRNQGFDHIEFIVHSIEPHAKMYQKMGFEKVGERQNEKTGLRCEVYAQGFVRLMLSEPMPGKTSEHPNFEFLKKHDEGVSVLAVEVEDANQAFETAVARGARPALKPTAYQNGSVSIIRSEIYTLGDIRYAFVQRDGVTDHGRSALFDEGMHLDRLESPSPNHIRVIDHLTNNVGIGEMKDWVKWYQDIMDFKVTRHFDIRTGRTGLISDVVESQDGKIKVPVNEATEPESQVQEFVNRFKGVGVQHLAFLTTNLIETIGDLKKKEFNFLDVPSTYYDAIPNRVPNHKENLTVLEGMGVLIDGDETGYLLQLFTEEMVGPFFFEFIERKGNRGFGEGNFQALFEAIERDQIKRGVLQA